MHPSERRATFALSLIVSLRMLGLMMVLPLFVLEAGQYQGATASLVGLAFGAYGLTQALLQIPLGMLSDYVGRKPVMVAGLLMLALGSAVAATGHSISSLMLGRILQGGGAIGSTAIACLADLTQEESRSKAMAILGISIGVSFFLSMMLGPLLSAWISLSGIFWCTGLFALLAIAIVYGYLPTPPPSLRIKNNRLRQSFTLILSNAALLQLNVGVFFLHAISTASFVALPLLLKETLGLNLQQQWKIYLPVLLIAFILTFTLISFAEKKAKNPLLLLTSISSLGLAETLFYFFPSTGTTLVFSLLLLLTVFSILEALLPALVSKLAPPENKGAAMGLFSSSQFLGIFAGGALGGLLHQHCSLGAIFLFAATLAAIWLALYGYKKIKGLPSVR